MKRLKQSISLKQLLLWSAFLGLFFVVALISYADGAVGRSAEGRIYSDVQLVPEKKTALLLGTNKYVPDGRLNRFYTYRINAATDLFKAGKVQFILISGDNGTPEYSEPELMQADLMAAGIPEEKIYLDYAGFRTWDSIVRANKVFLEDDFVIISQGFHNARALYTAHANGIEAIAFNAQDVPVALSPRIWLRERLARVNVLLDVLLHTKPKFLGKTIEIH